MAERERNRKVPLALELGYKLNLHASYFEAIQGKTIDAEHWPGTLRHVREELEAINEYWQFFFERALDKPTDIGTQEGICDYLGAVLRTTKAKIHVRYGDPVEAALELGTFFALNDLAPPQESIQDRFFGVVRDLLYRLGMKADDALQGTLSDLGAEEVEKRACARKELFKRIESLFGEKVSISWLTGFELAAGIPGLVQLTKAWK